VHVDRAAHGIYDAWKFKEQTVAGGLNGPATMFGDFWIDELSAMSLQRGKRPALIGPHEASADTIAANRRCSRAIRSLG